MHSSFKTVLATAAFLIGAALPSSTTPTASAAAEIDVSVFYRSLAPYGEWVETQPYGWAFVPENMDYGWRPYTVGQWAWVEPYGWTWVSQEPFGWATYHYGRWIFIEDYGWAWLPGTTWAPAWVAFRFGDPWVGWAPLPPASGWRLDAGLDLAGLNADAGVGVYAWTFVSARYFAEPDLRSRYVVNAYNPYLVQRTQWSTRYAAVDGGVANLGVDVAYVDRARGTPVERRRLQEAPTLEEGSGSRVKGDALILYRPRITPKAAGAPVRRASTGAPAPTRAAIDAWAAQRKAALEAHLEAEKKALEHADGFAPPATPETPKTPKTPKSPGMDAGDDAPRRREAGLKALEDERKRLEALLERQRKRRERELDQPREKPADAPPPPAMGDDGHGKKDGGGNDKDKKDGGGHGK